LIALYFRVMKFDPQNPRWPQRDHSHPIGISVETRKKVVGMAL